MPAGIRGLLFCAARNNPPIVAGFFMRGRMAGMVRFDTKALLYSIALVSLGLGALYIVTSSAIHLPHMCLDLLLVSIGPLIGAGLFLPFGLAWVGVALGLLGLAVRQVAFIYLLHDRQRGAWIMAVLLWVAAAAAILFAWHRYTAKK